jgi:eukaryotic-like serine/threonine-protein kinase
VNDDRLKLNRRIAAGGVAEVFLGEQRLDGGHTRLVAVKRLLPQHRHDREYALMLEDESRIVAQLAHPNVVRLLDTLLRDGEPMLVFEHVSGMSLADALNRTRQRGELPPPEAAAEIAIGVASALCYVHDLRDSRGRWLRIVHRDLNPNNILITDEGVPKVIDFGIAYGEGRVYETATGTLKGSVSYMAPEQLSAGAPFDHRVDVFAFGIALYELFAGVHPFTARTQGELFERLEAAEFTAPAEIAPGVPPALCRLIERSLARDPTERPASMRQVIDSLRDVCSSAEWHPSAAAVCRWLVSVQVPSGAESVPRF